MMRALHVLQERVRERVRLAVASEPDVVAAVRRGHREMDGVVDRALAREPSACSAGCSYCCHVHVEVTRAEVAVIAGHLASNRAAVVAKLSNTVRVVSSMDHDQRWAAKIPCALLGDDGRCTIYEVRPLRCRAFHSFSLDACREAFAGPHEPDPVTNAALDRACDAAEHGFDRALEDRGLSADPVLLEAALREALS